jgi:hypothetical protein
MFDNPGAHDWQPVPHQPPLRRGPLCVLVLAAVLLGGLIRPPPISNAPSRLCQIETVVGPGNHTAFYLHDAGYRLVHRRVLILEADGAGGWSAQWDGSGRVHLALAHCGPRQVHQPPGIVVDVSCHGL